MSSYTPITITGTFKGTGGIAAFGQVTFQLTVPLVDNAGIQIVSNDPLTFVLNGSGQLPSGSIVPANNDPLSFPLGTSYLVTFEVNGQQWASNVIVPYNAAGGTIDMTALKPALQGPTWSYGSVTEGAVIASGVTAAMLGGATGASVTAAVATETTRATAAEALAVHLGGTETITGTKTVTADIYFKSGRPWFDVVAFGADPTGATDSTVAINLAIAAANTAGGGTVFFPVGVYLISMVNGTWALNAYAGITLRGIARDLAYIKVAASVGNYANIVQSPTSADCTGFVMEDLTFDANNVNNLISSAVVPGGDPNAGAPQAFYGPTGGGTNVRRVLNCVGSNLRVRRCRFTDIDSTGVLYLANATNLDCWVEDNLFDNIGLSAVVHDHSAVYCSATSMRITGNTFRGYLSGGVGGANGARTAIETHGPYQTVTGNKVFDFAVAGNITGITAQETDACVVAHNHAFDVVAGWLLWSNTSGGYTSGYGLRNVLVVDNTVTVNRDEWYSSLPGQVANGISLAASSNLPMDMVTIARNSIRYLPSTTTPSSTDQYASGICVRNSSLSIANTRIFVDDNVIYGSLSAGIILNIEITAGSVSRNRIYDAATTLYSSMLPAYFSGMFLGGVLTNVVFDANEIVDDQATHTLGQGIYVIGASTSDITGLRGFDNRIQITDGTNVPLIHGDTQTGNGVLVRASVGTFVTPTGLFIAGSTILEKSTGITWTQTATPSGSTWANLLPTGGTAVTAVSLTRGTQATAPTMASLGTGVATATLDASATDMSGCITITMNGSPALGAQCTFTFHTARASTDYVILLTWGVHAQTSLCFTSKATSGFTIYTNSAPAASAVFEVDYLIIG
jgi:hypothetical protein